MSSFRDALKAVKSDIKTVHYKSQPHRYTARRAEPMPPRPKQYVNGYEVYWDAPEGSNRKIPYICGDEFYIQYPTKSEDIKLPEGTVRATYNFEKRRVEFFKAGSDEPIRWVADARHEPLPVPEFMRDLEVIEEMFEIDFETGEITTGMKVDILPEGTHWKLRLQEFEARQLRDGVKPSVINFRLQRYLKNLEAVRGVTVEMLSEPIPQNVRDAIAFSEKKRLSVSVGK